VSTDDRERWNRRHAERPRDFAPAKSLAALADRLRPTHPGARALDLACGSGRNALFLAQLGYAVDAWDISDTALATLQTEIERRRAAGQHCTVNTRQVDLDAQAARNPDLLPASSYDLVLNYLYLERALFRPIARALRPGGLLVFETILDSEPGRAHLPNPAYRLAPGELRSAFPELDLLEYAEDPGAGRARLVAARPDDSGSSAPRPG
jgi:SAM-dependent methyltransferase